MKAFKIPGAWTASALQNLIATAGLFLLLLNPALKPVFASDMSEFSLPNDKIDPERLKTISTYHL
jgi:hypothetical protein